MTKKKKQVKKEVIVATYHGDDPPKTLEELEKESDLSRLAYLEALAKWRETRRNAKIAQRNADIAGQLAESACDRFNEITCQYMAMKHGIKRDKKTQVSAWTAEMAYAK